MTKKLNNLFPDSNIPVKLQHDWMNVMNHLNKTLLIVSNKSKNKVKNMDNQIVFGYWKIYVCFINSDYLELKIDFKDEQRLTMRHNGRISQLSEVMLTTLKYSL